MPSCSSSSSDDTQGSALFPEMLSSWKLFDGFPGDLVPREDLIPYTLSSALFSDYAEKSRFIRLPENTQMTTDAKGKLIFPDDALIVKNFFYYNDERFPDRGKHVIETRLLLKKSKEWEVATYIWNTDQSEAYLEILGGERDITWTDVHGSKRDVNYIIPDNNDCKSCHLQDGVVKPIGPRIENMRCASPDGQESDQINWLSAKKLLSTENLNEPRSIMVDYRDTAAPLDDRALAYLDIHCAHCHSEIGPASNTGLFLHHDQHDLFRLGIMKTPVSAAQGSGGFDYNVVPGDSSQSILVYRMKSLESGIAMPEVGRTLVHAEGVDLINKWIQSLD